MTDNTDKDLLDELAADFMERRRRGENPQITEYTPKYPDLATDIQDLFPTITALENLKQAQDRSPNGLVQTADGQLTQLDDFAVVGEIGRGGMGVVYEAVQESLDRRVALKVLPALFLAGNDALARFRREARIVALLEHPGIVPVYSFGEAQGHHYIAMQRIRGVGWDRLITRLTAANQGDLLPVPEAALDEGCVMHHLARTLFSDHAEPVVGTQDTPADPWVLPLAGKAFRFGTRYPQEVAALTRQAAEALQYAHSQDVWHRDIKPSNLLLDVDGRVWITDFGLAKVQNADSLTATGKFMGTLRFMAPENFEGRHDHRSDIYSLGQTLYELLTLQPAFQGNNPSELINRILHEAPPPPRSINPGIPADLEAIIQCASARNPAARYATAAAMDRDLERFLGGESVRAAVDRAIPIQPVKPERLHPAPLILGVLLAVAALVSGILFFSEDETVPPAAGPAVEKSAPAPRALPGKMVSPATARPAIEKTAPDQRSSEIFTVTPVPLPGAPPVIPEIAGAPETPAETNRSHLPPPPGLRSPETPLPGQGQPGGLHSPPFHPPPRGNRRPPPRQ